MGTLNLTVNGKTVTPNTYRKANEINTEFPRLTSIGGFRPTDVFGEHSTGRALDLMLPFDGGKGKDQWDDILGQKLIGWIWNNRVRLDLQHIIYRQQIRSIPRAKEGWRLMEDRGSYNDNHFNHVHVLWAPTDKYTAPVTTPMVVKYEVVAVPSLNVRDAIGGKILKVLKTGDHADVVETSVVTRNKVTEIWGKTVPGTWVCIKQGTNTLMKKV